jgi:hypothetical protein
MTLDSALIGAVVLIPIASPLLPFIASAIEPAAAPFLLKRILLVLLGLDGSADHFADDAADCVAAFTIGCKGATGKAEGAKSDGKRKRLQRQGFLH